MYFLITLFFVSLLGISFMIGRKLLVLQDGQILTEEEILQTPILEEWKHSTVTNVKKHGYNLLVIIIRLYVRSSNFIKNKYQEFKTKLQNINSSNTISEDKQEISKFLKVISDYKHKIRKIKQKIKEEENL